MNEDGSIPEDADLYPMELSGSAQQGSNEYLALGCTTCHTQQVRLEEAGFDVERGWGDRPSVPRDYILQENILLGNTRIGPDLANLGLREYSEEWLHTHLFEPQSIDPQSICPPSPFLYEVSSTKKAGYFKLQTENAVENARFIKPSIRADRIIYYLLLFSPLCFHQKLFG